MGVEYADKLKPMTTETLTTSITHEKQDDRTKQILLKTNQLGSNQRVELVHSCEHILEPQEAVAKPLMEQKHFHKTVSSNTTQNISVSTKINFSI